MEEEEHVCEECPKCKKGAPAWMATFADMATLLMAFFVLILSFAEMNVPKFKMITGSLKNAFGVQQLIPVVEQPKGTTIIEMSFSPNPTPSVTEEMRQDTTDTVKPEIELQQKDKDSDYDTQADAQKVSEALAEEIAKGQVEVRTFGDRVVVQFTPQEVTEENKPQLEKETQNALKKVLNAAAEVESPVKMSGLDPATMGISTAASDKPEQGSEGSDDQKGSLGNQREKGLESELDEGGVNKGDEQSEQNSQKRDVPEDGQADAKVEAKAGSTEQAKAAASTQVAAQAAAEAAAAAANNGATAEEVKAAAVSAAQTAAQAMNEGKTVTEALKDATQAAGSAQGQGAGDKQARLDRQQKKLQSSLKTEIAQGLVKVERRDGKLKITVGAGGAFPSGGAELTPQARQIIAKLGQVVENEAARVEVSGHTDNVPLYYSQKYRDNWDLAAARASSVVQEIGNSSKLKLEQMKAVSYGESKPIESNDKPEGREKNRRIEIDVSY